MWRVCLWTSVVLALVVSACAKKNTPEQGTVPSRAAVSSEVGLARLAAWMTGSFTNTAQAARDTNFADIRLEMWPIWPDLGESTTWLYVEQAMAGHEERPYRQRVYRVRALDGGRYESAVFLLPRAERFVGAWRRPDAFASLTPDSLELRAGCAIVMTIDADGHFVGGTHARDCQSELRGASYATSSVRIDAEGLDTLNQGFDETGTQVWGSMHGPYEFRRR